MTKRFFSLVAVLAISLLAACAQQPINTYANYDRPVTNNCCGSCPCGTKPVFESEYSGADGYRSEGKMCDPATKKKHHRHRHHAKAEAGASTIPSGAPVKKEETPKAKDAKKAEPEAKKVDVLEGVKKIMKDVSPKDPKKAQ